LNQNTISKEQPEVLVTEKEPFSYWGPLVAVAFFGFLAVFGTFAIFILGVNPSPMVWSYYILNIITTLSVAGFLINDYQKCHQ
jgi:hypothetical protein